MGNRTECALLMLLRTWNADYTVIRATYASAVDRVWDFDSAKKMASVLIKTANGYRLYNKARAVKIALQLHEHVHLKNPAITHSVCSCCP